MRVRSVKNNKMYKEAISIIDNGEYIIVIDVHKQLWQFEKKKGKPVVANRSGGYKKCKIK